MTVVKSEVLKDTYRDSAFLMKISSAAISRPGIEQASAMMATERNKELFLASGLMTPSIEAAGANDLALAVSGDDQAVDEALGEIQEQLKSTTTKKRSTAAGAATPTTISEAVSADDTLNLAMISVPGEYAKYEAAQALKAGMNVMLFSDNISVADELSLKQMASEKGLLVMGPDCGTAIVGGVPLAFANSVRSGRVTMVGGSGSGFQEVFCLLERFGIGIRNAFGTGGRDLKDEIGGISTLSALQAADADPDTDLVMVVSKPPGTAVRSKLLKTYASMSKPVVVAYAGMTDTSLEEEAGVTCAANLEEAARQAAAILNSELDCAARAVYGGGSLCYEAAGLVVATVGEDIYSNISVIGGKPIADAGTSTGHTFLDMGDDAFTVGRPHPMIAPELKMERVTQELCDPETAVVLVDLVIGYGSHQEQAKLLVEAREKAAGCQGSAQKVIIASVTGTDLDYPSRKSQVEELAENGIVVAPSNAEAALLAGKLVSRMKGKN
jgi:FdrA protein